MESKREKSSRINRLGQVDGMDTVAETPPRTDARRPETLAAAPTLIARLSLSADVLEVSVSIHPCRIGLPFLAMNTNASCRRCARLPRMWDGIFAAIPCASST